MQLISIYFRPPPLRALRHPGALAPSDKPSVSFFVLLLPWSPGNALGLTLALVARVPKPTSLRPWAGTPKPNPRGVRAGLARTGYRLAVVKPILAERYCRALVVCVSVTANGINHYWGDNKRVGRVLRRA